MPILKTDEAAKLWNKTKDPKYKTRYRLLNYLQMELHLIILQTVIQSDSNRDYLSESIDLFEYCDIWRNQLTLSRTMNRYIIARGEFKAHIFCCVGN